MNRQVLALGGGFFAAATGVAYYALHKPIGENIPAQRRDLREQGATNQKVSSGTAAPEEVVDKKNVTVRGGDEVLEG